ncbi:hypothetical protein NMY22_g14336 [Coprinellus aureogranulatus]|nr:hypothetical protein NMY22_g14336 [Coprinellus aureogranulatus]
MMRWQNRSYRADKDEEDTDRDVFLDCFQPRHPALHTLGRPFTSGICQSTNGALDTSSPPRYHHHGFHAAKKTIYPGGDSLSRTCDGQVVGGVHVLDAMLLLAGYFLVLPDGPERDPA